MKFTLVLSILISMSFSSEKILLERTYTTLYYSSGKLKAKGWTENGNMEDYWTFYFENGNTSSKGAFDKNTKTGYWYFYNEDGNLAKKGHYLNDMPINWWVYYYQGYYENCIYQSDGKTRFCVTYENGAITKAKKYVNDVFLQQWSSITSFKKDNPNFKF